MQRRVNAVKGKEVDKEIEFEFEFKFDEFDEEEADAGPSAPARLDSVLLATGCDGACACGCCGWCCTAPEAGSTMYTWCVS